MAEKNLKGLLLHTLKDVYFAEHEILKALPKMEQAAQSAELKKAFEAHRAQTEQQVQRLNDVFALLNEQPQGEPCKAIQGIIAEGQEVMEVFAGGRPRSNPTQITHRSTYPAGSTNAQLHEHVAVSRTEQRCHTYLRHLLYRLPVAKCSVSRDEL